MGLPSVLEEVDATLIDTDAVCDYAGQQEGADGCCWWRRRRRMVVTMMMQTSRYVIGFLPTYCDVLGVVRCCLIHSMIVQGQMV